MVTIDERVAVLEANDKNIFHQLEKHEEQINNIQRLAIATEKIADKTDNISAKVDQIDNRLSQVESKPLKRSEKYKELILSAILTGLAGIVVGVLTTLIIK